MYERQTLERLLEQLREKPHGPQRYEAVSLETLCDRLTSQQLGRLLKLGVLQIEPPAEKS